MDRLERVCKALRVGNLKQFVHEVEFHDKEQYLIEVLELALRHRENRRIERLIKQACFPVLKDFVRHDFARVTFPNGMDKERLLSLEFIEQRENILCIGAIGAGKTSLAVTLGRKACMHGKAVRFYRAVDLATELADRHREGTITRLYRQLAALDMLIIDELGFIPFDRLASQLLFNVISASYQRQSIIVTSNLEFGRWNEVFGDDRLTAALIDRLVHYSHILAFSGPSYRYEQAMLRKEGGGAYLPFAPSPS